MTYTIGIIGAMNEEIAVYLKHLENVIEKSYKIFTLYEGTLVGKKVVLVKSGVGKVFAAMITQYLIDVFKVNLILFTGVGGALNRTLTIGDVVVGKDCVFHDFDAIPLGFKRGQISYTNYRFFAANEELVRLALQTPLTHHKIMSGRILTGDQFFTQAERNEHRYLTQELEGDCIEMEGAAVAVVCTINEIPHLVMRTMSDNADGKAVEDYHAFTSVVAGNSCKIVEYILKNL